MYEITIGTRTITVTEQDIADARGSGSFDGTDIESTDDEAMAWCIAEARAEEWHQRDVERRAY